MRHCGHRGVHLGRSGMIELLKKTYQNRTILLTGHTGFKGGWLALWLSLLGAKVIGYSLNPPSEPNFFDSIGLKEHLTHIHADVTDVEHLKAIFGRYEPEFVFHLAAQPLVRLSYSIPHATYLTNIMGTVNMLEAARISQSVHAIINVTSDKCYENREWVWGYRENDPMGGSDPYSSSKGCAELITSAYLRSFFSPERTGRDHQIALASVRAGNVIGGGDWGAERLLPDCIRALSSDDEIIIRYPKAVRPWQHVLEPIFGYMLLGTKLWNSGSRYAGGWNFGPLDSDISPVEEVVTEVIRLWGKGSYRVQDETLHEAQWLKLDCSKSRIELGWQPKYTLKAALKKTVEWYRKYYGGASKEDMLNSSISQIDEYTGKWARRN